MTEHTPPHDFAPVSERPFDLPDEARVAVVVMPNVEWFAYGVSYPSDPTGHVPNTKTQGWRDYGTRAGFWRLLDVLDDHDVPASVALNARVCDHAPQVVEAITTRDWEVVAHGLTNSQRLSGLDEAAEREVIRESRERIATATGEAPTGWLGPGLAETFRTPRLLLEEGFDYVCDWANDDQPYWMPVAGGRLVGLPASPMDDIPAFARRKSTADEFERAIRDQFDALAAEAGGPGNAKVLVLQVHPYVTGRPERVQALDGALTHITTQDGAWLATGREVVAAFVAGRE